MANNSTSITDNAVFSMIQLSEAVVIVVMNALGFSVFLSKTFRFKKSTYFLVNLTVADFMVGVTLIVLAAFPLVGLRRNEFYSICVKINFVSVGASVWSFTAIAIERTSAILAPFKHRLLGNKPYVFGISLIWVIAILNDLPTITEIPSDIFLTIKNASGLAVPIFIVFCYLAIWVRVKFAKSIANARQHSDNKKLTMTLFLVTLASFLCYFPLAVASIYNTWVEPVNGGIFNGFMLLIYMNSLINFLLYSFRMPEFRKELVKVLRKCLVRRIPTSEDFPIFRSCPQRARGVHSAWRGR
ncbi:melatonin receptor type 1A-like [Nematostella vectensis]|uniref:melatonin receptor type 1A-like n=1 Tax=Nematostella vectensis TaxID=45351 RepID=UPI002076E70C|nr:melatonin receptor type 1A-like [Nematostella vectensis]